MTIPQEFVSRLKREFPSLRIRFSAKRQSFQIEQQIGRGAIPPIHVDPFDDDLIRAKDGYWKVCEVRPGTTMPCEVCGSDLQVPALKFKEIRCEHCIRNGLDGRVVAGFFPLGELLLEHLRFLNPLTGGIQRNADVVDRHNKQLMESRERDLSNKVETMKDDYRFIAGVPMVGYTGNNKTLHWSRM